MPFLAPREPTMPTLYFAAPLFTDAERAWNRVQVAALRHQLPGWLVVVPHEFCASFDPLPGQRPDFQGIFAACVKHLENANVVLAVLDGADADSGTSWEVGFAYAQNKPIIGLRTDWRPAEDGAANTMLTRSCILVASTIDGVVERLRTLPSV
jgi:nucleoside 2-deoxyribosyltransferase